MQLWSVATPRAFIHTHTHPTAPGKGEANEPSLQRHAPRPYYAHPHMASSEQPPQGGRRKVVLGILAGALLVSGAIVAGVLGTRAQRKIRVAPQAIAVEPLAVSCALISRVWWVDVCDTQSDFYSQRQLLSGWAWWSV